MYTMIIIINLFLQLVHQLIVTIIISLKLLYHIINIIIGSSLPIFFNWTRHYVCV